MRFRNCIISHEINHAIKQVEKLLNVDSSMIKELQSKNDWRFNSGTSGEVIVKLLEDREPINVYTYRPWNPFSKAVGYYDGKAIHISVKALESFNFEKLCGLLVHEYSHYCGFSHGNNYKTDEKCKYSVPYFLSENITKWV
jgi:hypothetical protein